MFLSGMMPVCMPSLSWLTLTVKEAVPAGSEMVKVALRIGVSDASTLNVM